MILDKFQLTGKVAIVTGASRGLGQGMAVGLAEAGADIVLVARTKAALEKTAAAIQKVGRKAVVIPADLSSGAAEAERVVQETVKGLGHVDILLNVAGTQVRKPFFEMTEQDYEYLMSVNLKALFFISQAASKEMAKQSKGKIINITSLTSFIGISNISLYTASKGAVLSMTRELAVIHARENIRVNALCPGPLRTELLMKYLNTDAKKQRRLVHIPMGRFGEAKEIAKAVLFLASDESSFTTGATFLVDGGITAAYVTPE